MRFPPKTLSFSDSIPQKLLFGNKPFSGRSELVINLVLEPQHTKRSLGSPHWEVLVNSIEASSPVKIDCSSALQACNFVHFPISPLGVTHESPSPIIIYYL